MSCGSVCSPSFSWKRITLCCGLPVDFSGLGYRVLGYFALRQFRWWPSSSWLIFYAAWCKAFNAPTAVYAPIAVQSVLEGLLGSIVAANRHAPGSSLPSVSTFERPGTANNPLFRGVTTHTTHGSVQLSCRKTRIKRCLYFCRVTGHRGHSVQCVIC